MKRDTINTWAKRFHWTGAKDKISTVIDSAVASTIAQRLEQASATVQVTMSDKLLEQSQVLSQRKALSMLDLATQQPLVKSLVDTADKLYGWSRSDAPRCLVQVGVMAQFAPKAEPEQVINIKPEPA